MSLPVGERTVVERRFEQFFRQWYDETAHLSSTARIVSNPHYLAIIAMGQQALPAILRRLRDNQEPWFAALAAIARYTPPVNAEEIGKYQKTRQAWLDWGSSRGLISMGQSARIPQPDVVGWTPSVLTEYEIGRAISAAEQLIAKSDKPVTEVGCRTVASPDALLDDLRECLKLAGEAEDVKIWTRPAGEKRLRYGFYRDAWVVGALDFLDRTELPDADRAWINGLLFGYRSDAIQQFIERTLDEKPLPRA